jgi:predicted exporter
MNRRVLRAPALWVWLGLMLAGAWIAARTQYVADLSAFLPASPTQEQRVLLEQLKRGVAARVLLIGIEGGTAEGRADASRALGTQLRASPHFDTVQNGDHTDAAATGQFLFDHRYLLSPAVTAERFTVEGLRDGIDETVSLMGTPAGQLIKPLIWRDPTGETLRVAEALLPTAAPRVEQGVWVSRTAPRAVLLATTRAEGADLDGQAAAIAFVRERFTPLAAQGFTLELSGPGVFGVDARATIVSEVDRLALWGSVIIVTMLALSFGSLRALIIALLPVASGVLAGVVAVSLGFGHVHGMTLGFGTTLIGEAVDYAIYYLLQARPLPGQAAQGRGHLRWREGNWATVRLGLLTSVAGFAALAVSGFGGLAQLGVFSCAGLIAATLTTRYLLTLLAPDGAPGQGARRAFARAMTRTVGVLPRWRWPVAALSIAALVAVFALPSAWRGNLASLSPVPAQALARDAALRADLGAGDAGVLLAIEAADEAAVLARAEQAGAALDRLIEQGVLTGYDSPARLLPSPAMQRTRQAALPDEPTLRARLAEATAGGPLPLARLDGFVADVQAQRRAAPLDRTGYDGGPLAAALQAQLMPGDASRQQPWVALLNLHASGEAPLDVPRLRAALADVPGARIVQVQRELDDLYSRYLHQAFGQVALGGAAVLALLLWHLRSARALLQVVAPLAASVVLVLAGLTLAGVTLGLLHLVGLLLVVAVGSNYALFFQQFDATGGETVDADTLASLLLANLTLVASFGLLCTSSVPVLVALGETVAPGALLSLLVSAAFARRRG